MAMYEDERGPPPAYASLPQGAGPFAQEPVYPPQPSCPPSYPHPEYPGQPGYPQQPGYIVAPQSEYPTKPQTTQPVPVAQFGVIQQPVPANYMRLSWFVLLCCCIPLGLAAVIHSYSSISAASKGNYEKAQMKGKTAKTLSIVGIVLGIVFLVTFATITIVRSPNFNRP